MTLQLCLLHYDVCAILMAAAPLQMLTTCCVICVSFHTTMQHGAHARHLRQPMRTFDVVNGYFVSFRDHSSTGQRKEQDNTIHAM